MKLKESAVNYSPMEKELLSYLQKKPQSTVELRQKFYGARQQEPYYSQQIVVGVLKSLARKVRRNKETFVVKGTNRAGPTPMSFWLEGK